MVLLGINVASLILIQSKGPNFTDFKDLIKDLCASRFLIFFDTLDELLKYRFTKNA